MYISQLFAAISKTSDYTTFKIVSLLLLSLVSRHITLTDDIPFNSCLTINSCRLYDEIFKEF